MKPKFSILALLGITASVAVACAGAAVESSWNTLNFLLWIAVLFGFSVEGNAAKPPRSVFALGTLATTMMLTLAAVVIASQMDVFFTFYLFEWISKFENWTPESVAPVWRSLEAWLGEVESVGDDLSYPGSRLFRWAVCNSSLAFGLLGGYLTLWRYRVLERRANQEKSGE